MNRIFRNTIFYLLIFLVIIGVVSFFNGNNEPTEAMTYDQFVENLESGQVESLSLQPVRGVYEVRGQLEGYEEGKYFITYIANSDSVIDRVEELASDSKLEILPAEEANGWVTFFTTMIPFIIIFIYSSSY